MDARTLDRIALDRELVRRGGLRTFARLAWPLIEPVKLVGNWHVDLVCDALQEGRPNKSGRYEHRSELRR